MQRTLVIAAATLSVLGACKGRSDRTADGGASVSSPVAPAMDSTGAVSIYGNPRDTLTAAQLKQGRFDPNWRKYVQMDSVPTVVGRDTETVEGISPRRVNAGPVYLPIRGDVAGPSVMRVQVLLDRAVISPGVIDGMWGDNAEEAVYWFQEKEGLPATGVVDTTTYRRLVQAAGSPGQVVVAHRLTADDVSGPFVQIPDDVYEQAKLDCMCYESLSEKLAERFHTTPEVLQRLNPGVDLDGAAAGQTIQVPNVRDPDAGSGAKIAELVVSGEGHYVNALDASGRLLFHFPSTLGASYSPSPSGKFQVTSVTPDPKWYYQPALLTGVPDWKEPAMVPAGPNNPVGVVWMALSAPHYGIHGTSAPETIGYATSHGCIRLTNWDAEFLSKRIADGTPVHFRDIVGAEGEGTNG